MTPEEIELDRSLRRALAFARKTAACGHADPAVLELARAYLAVGAMISAQWKTIDFLDGVFTPEDEGPSEADLDDDAI